MKEITSNKYKISEKVAKIATYKYAMKDRLLLNRFAVRGTLTQAYTTTKGFQTAFFSFVKLCPTKVNIVLFSFPCFAKLKMSQHFIFAHFTSIFANI